MCLKTKHPPHTHTHTHTACTVKQRPEPPQSSFSYPGDWSLSEPRVRRRFGPADSCSAPSVNPSRFQTEEHDGLRKSEIFSTSFVPKTDRRILQARRLKIHMPDRCFMHAVWGPISTWPMTNVVIVKLAFDLSLHKQDRTTAY